MVFSILRHAIGVGRCGRSLQQILQKGVNVSREIKPGNGKMLTVNDFLPVLAASNTFVAVRKYAKYAKPQTSRLYDSDSSSDSEWEIMGHRGDSEFWRRKMRTFHGLLDVNKDGVISYDDFLLLADRFVNLGHLSPQHSKDFKEIIRNIWEKQWGEVSPYNLITVEQYLEDMHHVINDKDRVKRVCSFLPYIFKAVDRDSSGSINVEEFTLFFKCLGIAERDALYSFRIIDLNGDGKITYKEFIKHGRDFFLTEDENTLSKYFWGPLVEH